MYKVFIENRAVIFLRSSVESQGIEVKNSRSTDFHSDLLKQILRVDPGLEIRFLCKDPEKVVERFFRNYRRIAAAGGVVEKDGALLFIKRHGLWDLPKGKVEKEEQVEHAAVREVEEECGISGVVLKQPLKVTHHTYEMKGKMYLKSTHWFSMEYKGDETLKPQEEEGITEVKWISPAQLDQVTSHTYPSIVEVIETYLDQKCR